MSIILKSGVTSDVATVGVTSKAVFTELKDANANSLANVEGTALSATQGYVVIGARTEDSLTALRADRRGNLVIASHAPLLVESCEGTTFNTQRWTSTVTTFVNAQTATGISLNSTSLTTAAAVNVIASNRQFPKMQRQPLIFKARARISTVANSVAELGFGSPSGVTAIVSNGAFWRFNSAGPSSVVPVFSFNGTEITGSAVDLSAQKSNYLTYEVYVTDDEILYTIQNTQTDTLLSRQKLALQASAPKTFAVSHLPAFFRCYNATAPASAPVMIVGEAMVSTVEADYNAGYPTIYSGLSLGGEVSPTALTQNAQWANSAEPANATLSNTAAGYTTLGGKFQFAAVAGAVTDYALFGFTVPAPFSFFCTGIHIETWNTVIASATTPTLMTWALGVNSSSINLGTATVMRVPVGAQTIPVATAAGASVTPLDVTFPTPYRTDAGRLLIVILRMPVGTATATQVIAGAVNLNGYFV